jgi:exonuclease VII small subunit
VDTLSDAIARARKLVAALERQKVELEASPPAIPPDKLAEGKRAFENALASAKRMLAALEGAAEIRESADRLPETNDPS